MGKSDIRNQCKEGIQMGKSAKETTLESLLLKGKNIPILTLDNRWHQLFPAKEKPSHISKLELEVNSLIKRQSKVINELKELGNLKKNLMQEIVNNMEETIESKEAFRQKKLEKSRKIIKEINGKIDRLEREYENLPDEIRDTNRELLLSSIRVCYEKINDNRKDLKEINEWIEKTRIELKKRVVKKEEKEEVNARIYSYMHDIIGPGYMEYFDARNGI